MNRRLLSTAAAVSASVLLLAACGDGDEDADTDTEDGGAAEETDEPDADETEADDADAGASDVDTIAAVQEAGTIRIGTKFDQPGFGLQGLDGTPEGFDVEIAIVVAEALGLSEDDIEWVATPSAVREEVLETGEVDMVVATYTINDERDERIDFAGPYYEAGQDIMVAAGNTAITGPESFTDDPDLRVCSVTGSTSAENIREFLASEDQLTEFAEYSQCADALRNGQTDAVTTDNVILLGFVDEGEGDFELVGNAFTEEPYGIGLVDGDTAFCELINETLTEASESGAYEEAWTSTAGQVAGAQTPELPELDTCD